MIDYHINIFYSEPDEGYIADIPDLSGCTAFGKTPAIALEEVQMVKETWIEAANEANIPIPLPRYRPLIYQGG